MSPSSFRRRCTASDSTSRRMRAGAFTTCSAKTSLDAYASISTAQVFSTSPVPHSAGFPSQCLRLSRLHASSPSSTKRSRASPPPRPTPKGTCSTPANCWKAISRRRSQDVAKQYGFRSAPPTFLMATMRRPPNHRPASRSSPFPTLTNKRVASTSARPLRCLESTLMRSSHIGSLGRATFCTQSRVLSGFRFSSMTTLSSAFSAISASFVRQQTLIVDG